MRFFAREFDSENEEFWGIVGLLHDVDWEEYPTSEDHTIKGAEMIRAAGGSDQLVHAVQRTLTARIRLRKRPSCSWRRSCLPLTS